MKVGGPKRVMPYFLLNVLNCYYHCVFFSCIFIFIDLFLLFAIHMQFFFREPVIGAVLCGLIPDPIGESCK